MEVHGDGDSVSRCAAATTSVTQKRARYEESNCLIVLSSMLLQVSGSMSPDDVMENILIVLESIWQQIDEVISQAQKTRAVLDSQRSLFWDVQGKVKNLGDKFPVILGLLGSIRRRRRSRDTLILYVVIAACTLFIIIYWLSK
ncbi:hypothetical protein Bca4012_039333 [Brassica carinata]